MAIDKQSEEVHVEEEDNVVGALFQLNGEDNTYNRDDWIQDIAINDSTSFRISLAEDDGAIPGSLFACALWNGARFIAKYFADHSTLVKGKTVVEFGAASALPSLAALHLGAKVAVMTDYPNEFLLDNMRQNIARNHHLLGTGAAHVLGHLWGSSTEEVLCCVDQDDKGFDVAVVAECLWLHHLAYVSFAHHVPGHEENDLSFFQKAKDLYGFESEYLDTLAAPHVFNADKLVDQYLYRLTKTR